MKNSKLNTIIRYVLVFLLLTIQCPESIAQNDIRNIDNIFCIGNGNMAAYGAGADIIQVFGPPYSAPSLLDLKLTDSTIQVVSTREMGTAIWTHELKRGNVLVGKIVDLMDTLSPIFIRRFEMNEPVIFNVHANGRTKLLNNTSSYLNFKVTGAMLTESPRGTPFYNDYPMPFKQFMQVITKGNAMMDTVPVNGNFRLHVSAGNSFAYIVGGPLYPDCISFTHAVLSASYESVESRVRIFWKRFTERRKDFEKSFSPGVPDRKKLLWAIDAVAVNCKTQQSIAGGVLAGHNYHLGYVRDQYGVSRGLLKMGYYTEARGILDFFWQRW
ncbi:MAG TPA: hypothetical protein VHQ04_07110, partial [Puia sp.]|nr:hypothetical protein [Puia sp.]